MCHAKGIFFWLNNYNHFWAAYHFFRQPLVEIKALIFVFSFVLTQKNYLQRATRCSSVWNAIVPRCLTIVPRAVSADLRLGEVSSPRWILNSLNPSLRQISFSSSTPSIHDLTPMLWNSYCFIIRSDHSPNFLYFIIDSENKENWKMYLAITLIRQG